MQRSSSITVCICFKWNHCLLLTSSVSCYGLWIPVIFARNDQGLCSLTAESKDEGMFLRDEGSIWGFVSLRIQDCFSKNVFWKKEASESAHCIASILYKRVLSIFHADVYSSRPQRVGWGGAPLFPPHHKLSNLFLPGNSELGKVWMLMPAYALKNGMKREHKWKTWPERSKN